MSPAVHRRPRHCFMACCCCKRRSAGPARSSADGTHAMDDRLDKLGETIAGALADSLTGHLVANGELTISAISHDIVKVVRFLRDDERCQFWSLIDITAVDWPGRERRFDVVYHLLSPKLYRRIRIKIETDEYLTVSYIIVVFPGANWFELETCECYCFFIIRN